MVLIGFVMDKVDNGSVMLFVRFVYAVVGPVLRDEDWGNGDEEVDLEREVGEFFYFHYFR